MKYLYSQNSPCWPPPIKLIPSPDGCLKSITSKGLSSSISTMNENVTKFLVKKERVNLRSLLALVTVRTHGLKALQ